MFAPSFFLPLFIIIIFQNEGSSEDINFTCTVEQLQVEENSWGG